MAGVLSRVVNILVEYHRISMLGEPESFSFLKRYWYYSSLCRTVLFQCAIEMVSHKWMHAPLLV